MAKSMPTKSTPRSAEHLAPHQFGSPLRGTPSATPRAAVTEAPPARRGSKDWACDPHSDEVLPPLRR